MDNIIGSIAFWMFLVQKMVTKKTKTLGLPNPPPLYLGLSPKFLHFFECFPYYKYPSRLCSPWASCSGGRAAATLTRRRSCQPWWPVTRRRRQLHKSFRASFQQNRISHLSLPASIAWVTLFFLVVVCCLFVPQLWHRHVAWISA